MASNTAKTRRKREQRHSKLGRKRKNQEARKSTPSAVELFAGLGNPGEPTPKG